MLGGAHRVGVNLSVRWISPDGVLDNHRRWILTLFISVYRFKLHTPSTPRQLRHKQHTTAARTSRDWEWGVCLPCHDERCEQVHLLALLPEGWVLGQPWRGR